MADPITIGSVIVALGAGGVLTGLFQLLRSWLLRREERNVTIKTKVGNREVEMTYSPAKTSPEELTRLVNKVMESLEDTAEDKSNE